MSLNSGIQTVASCAKTVKRERAAVVALESHLVREYRVKFETFFTTRYTPRTETRVDLLPYIVPFAKALGFSDFHVGPRYLEMTNDQFQTLDNMAAFVVYCKELDGKEFTNAEKRVITACVAAAMLFTLGDDQSSRYIEIEKEAIHRFKVDIDRVRLYAKDAYAQLMSRLDQYLTCSPITPIYWSRVKSKKPAKATFRTILTGEEDTYGFFQSRRLPENPWIKRIRDKGLLD